MTHSLCRVLALLLLLALLPLSLLSCGKDEISYTAIPTLTVKNGELILSAALDSATLAKCADGRVYLFELAPGESVSALAEKSPIRYTEAGQRITFRLPLEENGSTRLYHSYAVVLSDGDVGIETVTENAHLLLGNARRLTDHFHRVAVGLSEIGGNNTRGGGHKCGDRAAVGNRSVFGGAVEIRMR